MKYSSCLYQIYLDTTLAGKLRNIVNKYQHYSINKNITEFTKKSKTVGAWERICAIMDRIEDTTMYLNSLRLNDAFRTQKYAGFYARMNKELCESCYLCRNAQNIFVRGAFDFYDFMNTASVLIDCIGFLAKIYDVDLTAENTSTTIFNQPGNDGKGTDKEYFEYLRSLCSVHPIETSRHARYQEDNTDVECSPFVNWEDYSTQLDFINELSEQKNIKTISPSFNLGRPELEAVVYTQNKNRFNHKNVPIYLSQVFDYVTFRYNLLNKIIPEIENDNNGVKNDFRNKKLPTLEESGSLQNFLESLKNAWTERVSSGYEDNFDFFINVCNKSFTNEKNENNRMKFQNAIEYASGFLYKYLQELPDTETFENTGIKNPDENTVGDLLFFHLWETPRFHSNDVNLYKKVYPFQNLIFKDIVEQRKLMISNYLSEIEDLISPYVEVDAAMSSDEIAMIVSVAAYFINLECDEILKENIPQDSMYR